MNPPPELNRKVFMSRDFSRNPHPSEVEKEPGLRKLDLKPSKERKPTSADLLKTAREEIEELKRQAQTREAENNQLRQIIKDLKARFGLAE